MDLTEKDKIAALEGSIFSVFVQLVLMSMIGALIFNENSYNDVCTPKTFLVFYVRFVSAFMMHLQLEP